MNVRAHAVRIAVTLPLLLAACGGPEERKAAYLERGRAQLEQNNLDKARVEFSNVLQIDPKDVGARYLLARTLEQKQDLRGAAGHYLRVIEEDPTHTEARVKMGEYYLLGGVPEKTMEQVTEILKRDPNNVDALVLRGSVKAQAGDVGVALEDARKAMELAPDNANAVVLAASLHLRRKDTDRAITLLKSSIARHPDSMGLRATLAKVYFDAGRHGDAEQELAAIVESEPSRLAHRLRLATFYTNARRLDDAEHLLREAVVKVDARQRTRAKLALADFLLNQRGAGQAIATLEGWVNADPGAYELRFALGNAYEGSGDVAKARRLYEAVAANGEESAQAVAARTRLAALWMRQKQADKAEPLIAEVLNVNARDKDALTMRGQIAMARQDYTAAIGDFRSVLKNYPDSIRAQRLLARAHFLNREPALARDTLKKAVDAYPEDLALRTDYVRLLAQTGDRRGVVDQLNEMLKRTPDNFVALEALFKVHAVSEDWDAAIDAAGRLKASHPDRPHGYYFAGLVRQAQHQLEASVAEFEGALARAPGSIEPLSRLVKSYVALDQRGEAMARLEKAAAERRENPVPHNLMGELLLLDNKPGQAIAKFREASGLNPKWHVPHANTAVAFEAQGNTGAAAKALQAGIAATSGSAALIVALASLHEREGQYEEAIAQYEAALDNAPDALVIANNLAMLLVDHRTDTRSIERARKLIEPLKSPRNAAFLDTVGWVQVHAGEVDAALSNLEQAVKSAPDTPALHYHLGVAYIRKGERDSALTSLRRAVDTDMPYQGLDKARAALQDLQSAG